MNCKECGKHIESVRWYDGEAYCEDCYETHHAPRETFRPMFSMFRPKHKPTNLEEESIEYIAHIVSSCWTIFWIGVGLAIMVKLYMLMD